MTITMTINFRLLLRCVMAVIVTLFLAACGSITWVDDRGATHVVGLAHVVFEQGRQEPDAGAIAGSKIGVQSVGVAVFSDPETTSLSLGYTKNEVIIFRENTMVGNASEASNPADTITIKNND